MIKRFLPTLALVFALFCTVAHATPFTVITKTGTTLPTTVNSGKSVFAYYTVTNRTGAQRNNNFVKILPPNVTQVTTGGTYGDTCGQTFNLTPLGQPGASCTLQLNISGAVTISQNPQLNLFVCFPGGTTCVGTYQPLQVTQISQKPPVLLSAINVTPISASISIGSTQQYSAEGIYSDGSMTNLTTTALWTSSNTSKATITNTGLATGVAVGTTNITATATGITSNAALLAVANPVVSLAITPTPGYSPVGANYPFTATATFADTTTQNVTTMAIWNSSNPSVATIGTTTGVAVGITLGTTTITASFSGQNATAPLNISTFAYFTTGSTSIFFCPISNSDSSIISAGCAFTGNLGGNDTWGIAMNSTGTALYVGDPGAGKIWYCTVNTPNATLNSCVATTHTGINPAGAHVLALNPASTFMYVPQQSSTILICGVSGSSLTSCAATGSGFNGAYAVAINPANTFAYIANAFSAGNSVSVCAVNPATGVLSGCSVTATGFNSPVSLTVNPSNTFVYVADSGNSQIAACPINAGGSLGSCFQALSTGSTNSVELNSAGTIAYVTFGNTSISTCTVNVNGTFSNCITTTGLTPSNGYLGITF
jgi:hypothetical protein